MATSAGRSLSKPLVVLCADQPGPPVVSGALNTCVLAHGPGDKRFRGIVFDQERNARLTRHPREPTHETRTGDPVITSGLFTGIL